jgi:PadR family transcriptional regulator PadR
MSERLEPEALDKLRAELRRGVIVLAVLAQLREEHYGYSLRKTLADAGIAVEEGTLYPLIRRLEKQGLLASQWRVEANRNKRFYSLSPSGCSALETLGKEWAALNLGVEKLLGTVPNC